MQPLPFLVVPLVFSYLVYRPVIGAYFYADDWLNLQDIANGQLLQYVLQPFAGHIVIIRNLIFYLSYQAFGMNAPAWFWTVLITHLVNVALLFVIVRLLCGDRLACLAATLWGTTPMHEGTLAWYGCYGQVIATTLVLVLLLDVVRVGKSGRPASAKRALAWSGLLFLAFISFGISIGLAFGFPLIVWLAFGTKGATRRAWWVLILMPLVVGITYTALLRLYTILYGGTAEAMVRLMVGNLVGLANVLGMFVYLFAAGVSGLTVGLLSPLGPGVMGPMVGLVSPLARSPNPLMISVSVLYAIAVIAAWVGGSRETRRWLVLVLGLAACGYGIIAAGRANFYGGLNVGTYGGAELRYHYLVPMMLAIGLALVLGEAGARWTSPRLKNALLAMVIGSLAVAWSRSSWEIDQHAGSREIALRTVAEIRSVLNAAAPREPVYIPNRPFDAAALPLAMFRGIAAVYVIFFPDDGRPVYFVEKSQGVRESVPADTRLARILVASDAAPQNRLQGRTAS